MRDDCETLSPIFIKGINDTHIVIENNTFDNNIGLHGGAVHIDLSYEKDGLATLNEPSTTVALLNNTFKRNMALFEGNAVFIKGAQRHDSNLNVISRKGVMTVLVRNCTFWKNYGLNTAQGSALAISG